MPEHDNDLQENSTVRSESMNVDALSGTCDSRVRPTQTGILGVSVEA